MLSSTIRTATAAAASSTLRAGGGPRRLGLGRGRRAALGDRLVGLGDAVDALTVEHIAGGVDAVAGLGTHGRELRLVLGDLLARGVRIASACSSSERTLP